MKCVAYMVCYISFICLSCNAMEEEGRKTESADDEAIVCNRTDSGDFVCINIDSGKVVSPDELIKKVFIKAHATQGRQNKHRHTELQAVQMTSEQAHRRSERHTDNTPRMWWSPDEITAMRGQLESLPPHEFNALVTQTEKSESRGVEEQLRTMIYLLRELNKNALREQSSAQQQLTIARETLRQQRRNAILYKTAIGALGTLATSLGTIIAFWFGNA